MESATAYVENDAVVFGLLMLCLGTVFYTQSIDTTFWKKFYSIVPAILLCYLLPALLNSFGIVDAENSQVYFIASRYLLPASLVLMTLSIDLKAIFNLGPKALLLFLTGTVGIIIGGPIAILIVSWISPETVSGVGPDAIWRGLSTIAGSWIGGGANQAAMLEIYQYNPQRYGAMVFIDVVIANIWTGLLLVGIGRKEKIDTWLQSDTSSISQLIDRVSTYALSVKRDATLKDYIIMLALAFGVVGFSHWGAEGISGVLKNTFPLMNDPSSAIASFTSTFFWLVTLATCCGIALSFTKARRYEGTGASTLGSIFIYILVASIGMKIDLSLLLQNPGLIAIGLIWMLVHVSLLLIVAKLSRAPYFFTAIGSMANVGGAASAPVVAAAFHPALTTVGVLLAVFGYAVGTYGAILCTILMQIASGNS